MKRVVCLFLLIFLVGCNRPFYRSPAPTMTAASPVKVITGSIAGQILSSGVTRAYILHIPSTYQPGTPLALVFNFHGFGSNASQQQNLSGMSVKADQMGFFVVYPEGIDHHWNTRPDENIQPDEQFIRDLVAALESQYSIDPKRIYATGLSNGGGMDNRLGCDMADIFAAIAPDSGAYYGWRDCKPSRPVPVLAFHGLDDKIVPYNGELSLALPPIRDWASAWAERDGCAAASRVSSPVATVELLTWSGCKGGAEVLLYSLQNHGHSWPGSSVMPKEITSQAVNATDLMWAFFTAHPMP